MQHITLTALTSAIVLAVIASGGLAELKEADVARVERVKSTLASELARANERYQKSVLDANKKATSAFNVLIQQYTRTGDTETANALQKQIDDLLASAIQTDITADGAAPKRGLNKALIGMIGPSLVRADGTKINSADLGSVDHVMLYFSASWCGPCRAFTPTLNAFFTENIDSKKVMVVLVGRDQSEAEMYGYMKSHAIAFPAIPFNRIAVSGVLQKYGARGIPNLVLLNTDGSVASGSYVDGKYVGPSKVIADARVALAHNDKPKQ